MTETIFTKIRLGKIPGEVVYKGDNCFVMLTIEPHNPGHVLVVPNEQIADWQDLPADTWLEMMKVAQMLGRVIKKIYTPPKVALCAVGFDILHVHIHVFSLFEISDIDHTKAKLVSMGVVSAEASKIRSELNNQKSQS